MYIQSGRLPPCWWLSWYPYSDLVSICRQNLEVATFFDQDSELSKVVISVLPWWHKNEGVSRAFHTQYCGGTRCFFSHFSSVQDCMEINSLSMLFLRILRFSCQCSVHVFALISAKAYKFYLSSGDFSTLSVKICVWNLLWYQTEMFISFFQTSFHFSI